MLSPFICINPHLHIQRETPATPPGMPAWAHNRPVKKLGVVPTYLPTYLQLFYYSKVRAAEHYCEANRGGLGRCPRASAVRQDTGTPLRPRLPHPRNCSKVALRLTQVLLPCAPTREQVPPVREDSRF